MALVHNVIIRGYNSIYLQAPRVKGSDTVDFLHYCEAWYILMIGHHDSEESILFPGIEKATGVKGIMDDDIHEHGRSWIRNIIFGQRLLISTNTKKRHFAVVWTISKPT